MTRCWLDGGVVPQHVGVVDPRIQGGRGCGATMASFDVYFQDAFKKAVWKPRPSKKIVRTLASFWSFLLLYLYLYLQVLAQATSQLGKTGRGLNAWGV